MWKEEAEVGGGSVQATATLSPVLTLLAGRALQLVGWALLLLAARRRADGDSAPAALDPRRTTTRTHSPPPDKC